MVKMTGALSTFNGISKESYYLTFNKDEVFKSLIACEGHFRNLKSVDKDSRGFLNCVVKHLADAEGHCDEAISHSLIVDGKDSSMKFLELRDEIRTFRKWIQSSPITREEGIREIRKIRRQFEGFNTDYDVSKCESCGDSEEIMKDLTKILSELKNNSPAVATHETDWEDFLVMEREMAEKLIAKLSEKYGFDPPKLMISDKCHDPNRGAYSQGVIYMCQSGVNLHVLAHEFRHHVQKEKGTHMDEGEAEKFAIDLFETQPQQGLYSNHAHSHNDHNMVKNIKDVGVIYGLQQLGYATSLGLKYADTLRPEGILGQPISLWGDILGTVGGLLGALYLKAPYDLVAAMVGGYLSTDLWSHLSRIVPVGLPIATPPALVYTTTGAITPPAVLARGRYAVIA